MIADRQLAADFWLNEAPCWWLATESQVAKLEETVARVAQPIRRAFGPTYITSWLWWSGGCAPRDGVHAFGGTIDLVVGGGRTFEAWEWGNLHLMPTGYLGRWIYEPEIRGPDGEKIQGEHIHAAPREDMIAYNGDARIQSLRETEPGRYVLAYDWTFGGTREDPFEIPGIEVVAGAGDPWWWLLGLALAIPFLPILTRQE